MRQPLIAGNWKMNNNIAESVEFVSRLKKMVSDTEKVEIVVAPPYTALGVVADVIKGSNIFLSSQNIFWEESGAFTGEISPSMLKDIGCQYAIIGHSERRQYFGETNETVNKRLKATLKVSLTPIVCIGEVLEEREAEKTLEVMKEVYEVIQDNFGFDLGNSAQDAFSLLGAICAGEICELDPDDDLTEVLALELTSEHPVWDHVRFVD